jgi:hypothetical protein
MPVQHYTPKGFSAKIMYKAEKESDTESLFDTLTKVMEDESLDPETVAGLLTPQFKRLLMAELIDRRMLKTSGFKLF